MTALRIFLLFILWLATETTAKRSQLAQALGSVITKSYVGQTKVFNLYVKCAEDVHRMRYLDDLVESALPHVDSISVRIGVHEQEQGSTDHNYCLLAVDSAGSLRLFYEEVQRRHFTIKGPILIVLHTFEGQHYYDALLDMFADSWRTGIVDVNVIVEPVPSLILMFTFHPYSAHSCKEIIPVISNRYTDSRWEIDEFFPFKLGNLHGCPLVCATWEEEPYLKIYYNDDGTRVLSGIEGMLLDFLAKRMNFTAQLYIMNTTEIDATLDTKGLVFDRLFRAGIDFVIGAFHYKPKRKEGFFAPSRVYYLSRIVIVLSSRRESISPIQRLLLPFNLAVWLLTLLYFGIGVIIVLSAQRLPPPQRDFILGSMNQIPVYNMFFTALGGGVHKTPRRNFARCLLCIWMLLWLVLRSGYQSALFHFMKSDISVPPPDNIDDVLREGYEILLTPMVYSSLKSLPSIQAASKFLNGSEVESFPMLSESKKKIAILTPFEYFGCFRKLNSHRRGEFYVVKKNVFVQPLSAYLKKDSYLVDSINFKIFEAATTGLLQTWHNQFVQIETRNFKSQPFKRMTVVEMIGPIEVYLGGVILSFAVFAFEVCMQKFSSTVAGILNKFS